MAQSAGTQFKSATYQTALCSANHNCQANWGPDAPPVGSQYTYGLLYVRNQTTTGNANCYEGYNRHTGTESSRSINLGKYVATSYTQLDNHVGTYSNPLVMSAVGTTITYEGYGVTDSSLTTGLYTGFGLGFVSMTNGNPISMDDFSTATI